MTDDAHADRGIDEAYVIVAPGADSAGERIDRERDGQRRPIVLTDPSRTGRSGAQGEGRPSRHTIRHRASGAARAARLSPAASRASNAPTEDGHRPDPAPPEMPETSGRTVLVESTM